MSEDLVASAATVGLRRGTSPRGLRRLPGAGRRRPDVRCAHVEAGLQPANQAGLHTIWLVRGETPPSPTA
jgi:hypothetical protein